MTGREGKKITSKKSQWHQIAQMYVSCFPFSVCGVKLIYRYALPECKNLPVISPFNTSCAMAAHQWSWYSKSQIRTSQPPPLLAHRGFRNTNMALEGMPHADMAVAITLGRNPTHHD